MKTLITNAFSLNMLSATTQATVKVYPISREGARKALRSRDSWQSMVGHEETAKVFSTELDAQVSFNRATVEVHPQDVLLVGQYKGPRLPEGAVALPAGASIQWMLVEIADLDDIGLNTLIDPQACSYCGSRDCIAVTHGESVCG